MIIKPEVSFTSDLGIATSYLLILARYYPSLDSLEDFKDPSILLVYIAILGRAHDTTKALIFFTKFVDCTL